MNIQEATARLRERTAKLRFGGKVAYVYRPLEYAAALTGAYEARFGQGTKGTVFFGMNPGPFGMAQTGVPFGEVAFVRDWMKIDGFIVPPPPNTVHPKRPILGLACTRSEVSGKRLWGAFATRHPKPETFFERAFVLNYCPLLFLAESGANLTPDKLTREERDAVETICDDYVRDAVAALAPSRLVGVGQYAEKRLRTVLGESKKISSIPHPSPASPAANKDWAGLTRTALQNAGIEGLM